MRKKWLLILLMLVSAFVLMGCEKDDTNDKKAEPRSVVISSESIKDNKITILINETVQLSAKVLPDDAPQGITWTSEKPTIASVDDGKITGLSVGKTEIYATSSKKATVYAAITVNVEEPAVVPDSISILGSDKVTVGGTKTLSVSTEPHNASKEVIWSSSDENICTISASGSLYGVALGTATITATAVGDETVKATLEVTVTADVGEVKISGESEMEVGTTLTLMAQVTPAGSSQNVIWESLQPTIATVNSSGVVTALKEGTTYIVATSEANPTIQGMHTIRVKPAQQQEPYPNLQGYVVKIYGADHALHEHDPFLELYVASDKAAKQDAWTFVQNEMNCTLKVEGFPAEAPWGQPRIDWLNQKATAGEAECDIFVSTTEWLSQLVTGGSALDVSSYYRTYGRNSMAPGLKSASTFKGGLYALIYPPIDGINVDHGLFYNYNTVLDLGLESPAKLFNEGHWTFDDFKDYVYEAKSRLVGENKSVLSGRPTLYFMGMVNSSGLPVADTAAGQLNFKHQVARDAADLLREIYVEVGWGDIAWDAEVASFNAGDSLFQSGEYWFVKTDNRWKKDLWGEDITSFGFVPYPYANNKTSADARTVAMGGACYMQSAGRDYPPHVNSKYVYRAFTEMMLKTAENVKDDITYDPVQKNRNAAASKLDDPESVEAILFFTNSKTLFDPLYELGGGGLRTTIIATAIENYVVRGEDYETEIDGIHDRVMQAMLEIYG